MGQYSIRQRVHAVNEGEWESQSALLAHREDELPRSDADNYGHDVPPSTASPGSCGPHPQAWKLQPSNDRASNIGGDIHGSDNARREDQ